MQQVHKFMISAWRPFGELQFIAENVRAVGVGRPQPHPGAEGDSGPARGGIPEHDEGGGQPCQRSVHKASQRQVDAQVVLLVHLHRRRRRPPAPPLRNVGAEVLEAPWSIGLAFVFTDRTTLVVLGHRRTRPVPHS